MERSPQVALVTGAAGNLGRAVAARFAAAGYALILVDCTFANLTDEASSVRRITLDLEDNEAVLQGVQDAVDRSGRIDVLCNIAGGFSIGEAVHQTSDETWRTMFGTNVTSLVNVVRAAVPYMIAARSGKVINVAAIAGTTGAAHMSAYCASKSAVIRITESMSAELRKSGINVNCVLPSIIDTPKNRTDMPRADFSRWVPPDALADFIFMLASDAARAVHGAAIPVTGLVG
jgi:NAD(P)-dependent dehydrogenase (short-subunit alcohol dehydrogenase family)